MAWGESPLSGAARTHAVQQAVAVDEMVLQRGRHVQHDHAGEHEGERIRAAA